MTDGVGRKLVKINWERVDELLACGCLGTEIASALGVHHDTLYAKVLKDKGETFSSYAVKQKARGNAILREAQYKKALGITNKGDNTLLNWLGS